MSAEGGAPNCGARRAAGPEGRGLQKGGAKISRFFPSPASIFFFLPLLEVNSCHGGTTLAYLDAFGTSLRTFSAQVRICDSTSQPSVDSGIAQGPELSFALQRDNLAASPTAMQFYAVDVVLSESHIDLQVTLGHSLVLHFGYGPNKVGRHVAPAQSRPDCHVHLGGVPLHVVTQNRCLGCSLLTQAGVLLSRMSPAVVDRLFHQSSAWCHGGGLPVSFAVSVFDTCVLSSACFGLEFVGDDAAAVAKAEHFRCSAVCAPWTAGSRFPLGLSGALQLCAHCQRLSPVSLGFLLVRRRWPSHVGALGKFVFAWIVISITDWQPWQLTSVGSRWTLQQTYNSVYSRNFPFAWSRLWGPARWDHDPSITGRSATRVAPWVVVCAMPTNGSLIHHLAACPCHIYARDVWAQSCGLPPSEASA